ncbi:putative mitochondrial ABC transporter [Leptomonas pyrrhocoris]|uniref:Putative mitochondrial ABC transporter n=1 Tax=Leptomonas pyrrhocoris TaxID=157538 RepID=A0A0M9FUY2_LEPPY|nr:putative mitochondrial ABC transporter [Leptomonas pyrrhocoris]XP_015655045.1 putative mitochondrial ABC transporter [Leptomonas pyrrhocoris]KPA76605.1 putative mitochondrial ABC transporter [Leptomonas pyrrhocoris]KPA76606.1 putative mitochondrial ABC transporter [Leptomonas pyrrhocoris]|eukprot:XP_015655044.1 putative mitochondrial ABC transporter [Leptomonas pyrrhocoris]
MSHVLPKEYTDTLKVLLDRAPPVPVEKVRQTIMEDTGKKLEDVFLHFDDIPVASASIAQVHQAWLPPPVDGSSSEPVKVAVKVRKPCISTQSMWDLYTYSTIMKLLKLLFDLPTDWSCQTVCDALEREMDFTMEAANARRFRRDFAGSERVYIPRIFDEFTTKQLLVMEWIDGTKLLDVATVRAHYDEKKVLTTLFDAVGDMVFKKGFVHSDPHAANVLVRPMPMKNHGAAAPVPLPSADQKRKHNPNDYQVVLIDFGLAVPERVRFRYQYALLFVSLFTRDFDSLQRVVHDWGIADAEMFASVQAQKSFAAIKAGQYGEVTREEVFEMQRNAHARAKEMLRDMRRIPKELIMVGRSLDILRGINRLYGSPVNRINMFVKSAVECLGPLHNYDAVERYLSRMQLAMEERGVPLSVRMDSCQDYGSVYNASAEAVRAEQEAALAQIEAEDKTVAGRVNRFSSRTRVWVAELYRAFLLNTFLTLSSVLHLLTYTCNSFLALMLPAAAEKRFHIANMEERLAHRMGRDDVADFELEAAASVS